MLQIYSEHIGGIKVQFSLEKHCKICSIFLEYENSQEMKKNQIPIANKQKASQPAKPALKRQFLNVGPLHSTVVYQLAMEKP